jgi:hypothetical protein
MTADAGVIVAVMQAAANRNARMVFIDLPLLMAWTVIIRLAMSKANYGLFRNRFDGLT